MFFFCFLHILLTIIYRYTTRRHTGPLPSPLSSFPPSPWAVFHWDDGTHDNGPHLATNASRGAVFPGLFLFWDSGTQQLAPPRYKCESWGCFSFGIAGHNNGPHLATNASR